MNKIGLVLSGGGGKGAYEIGVWKYLHETGLESMVSVVSGTSVGALNAALFTGASYEMAEKLWTSIQTFDVLTPQNPSILDYPRLRWIGKIGKEIKEKSLAKKINNVVDIRPIVIKMLEYTLRNDGFFSREGMESMINRGVDFKKLNDSLVSCFVTCVRKPGIVERFRLNDYEKDEVIKLLLASSAIPGVFPSEQFDGGELCDGGVPMIGDNTPISPVYKMKVDDIIIVYLSDSKIDKSDYSNVNIIEIVPSVGLGGFVNGTLDFSQKGVEKRIRLGYEDAKRVLSNYEKTIKNDNWEVKKSIIIEEREEKNNITFEGGTDMVDEMYYSKGDLFGAFDGLLRKYTACEEVVNSSLKSIKELPFSKLNFTKQKRIIEQQMSTAQNKFTIATIGEFKAGKSTVLNTLLGLSGESELSSEFRPDTAKAIRIMKKQEKQDYEAEIIYREGSDYKNEKMNWIEAKKFTSQVALDNDPYLKRKADQISEVRYYLDLEILDKCNFLDLPGLGADYKHDAVTIEKSSECDAVFWIVSNTDEISQNNMQQFQLLKHKIIPIINIWVDEETLQELDGNFTFEEMKEMILRNVGSYLCDAEIMKYCAKAIKVTLDGLQDEEDNNSELEGDGTDSWGYYAMKECLMKLVYGEGVDLEKEKKDRMCENVLSACDDMNSKLEELKDELSEMTKRIKSEKTSVGLVKQKIYNAYNLNKTELKRTASNSTESIIQKMNEASELFIETKMSSGRIKTLLKSITKNGRERVEKEFEKEYTEKYLGIRMIEETIDGQTKRIAESAWLNSIMEDFMDDISAVFGPNYEKVGIELEQIENAGESNFEFGMDFFDSIIDNIGISFSQQMQDLLPIIISTILIYNPGHAVVDAALFILSLFKGNKEKSETKFEKRVEQAKRRARLSISLQKHRVLDKFREIGKSENDIYRKKLIDKVDESIRSIDNSVDIVSNVIEELENTMEYYDRCKDDLILD